MTTVFPVFFSHFYGIVVSGEVLTPVPLEIASGDQPLCNSLMCCSMKGTFTNFQFVSQFLEEGVIEALTVVVVVGSATKKESRFS